MRLMDKPEWKALEAKLGSEELLNRLMWFGTTSREFERDYGRKPTTEDWKNIQAVLGGEYEDKNNG
jgi:hypothetical protein